MKTPWTTRAAGGALGPAATWLAGHPFMFTLHAEEARTALRARLVEQNATRTRQTAANPRADQAGRIGARNT